MNEILKTRDYLVPPVNNKPKKYRTFTWTLIEDSSLNLVTPARKISTFRSRKINHHYPVTSFQYLHQVAYFLIMLKVGRMVQQNAYQEEAQT